LLNVVHKVMAGPAVLQDMICVAMRVWEVWSHSADKDERDLPLE